jgi:hypothetical protein
MEDREKDQSTLPEPIFVGSGPEGDQAANFLLTTVDQILREQEEGLQGPLGGDLSEWIAQLWTKPIQFKRQYPPIYNKAATLQIAMKEAAAMAVDPGQKEEKQITDLIASVPPQDLLRMMEAFQAGKVSEANQIRSAMVDRLRSQMGNRMPPESIAAFAGWVQRGRAAQAAGLCLLLYKVHPLILIAQARKGARQAVLNLIKVDKLFLNDSCTAQVIRDAGLQKDRPYLEQLSRAIKYRYKYSPKTRWRQGCRLYLYLLFSFDPELQATAKIHLRIDPDGTRFKTFGAFQRYFERAKNEFNQLRAGIVENPDQKT